MSQDIYDKWVATMQPLLNSKNDDFEEIVTRADAVAVDENYAKWALGDIAQLVDTKYGEDRFGELADRIGENKGTLGNRKRLCEFWEQRTRWSLILECQNIRYSHFTIAMRVGKNLGSTDDEKLRIASGFILECSDNDWKPTVASIEAKKRLGEKIQPKKIDSEYYARTGKDGNALALLITEGDIGLLEDGKVYKIAIYEVPEQEQKQEMETDQ